MHEYLISYAFKTPAGTGHGNIIITSKGPLAAADLPDVIKEVHNSPGMRNAEIVLLAFSKF